MKPLKLYCDIKAVEHLANSPVYHEQTVVDCHSILDKIENKEVVILTSRHFFKVIRRGETIWMLFQTWKLSYLYSKLEGGVEWNILGITKTPDGGNQTASGLVMQFSQTRTLSGFNRKKNWPTTSSKLTRIGLMFISNIPSVLQKSGCNCGCILVLIDCTVQPIINKGMKGPAGKSIKPWPLLF